MDSLSKSTSSLGASVKSYVGGRAYAYNGGAWGKEKIHTSGNVPHLWRMWKLNSVHEILKCDYQLRPVVIEIFSMDGCNDLLVFHKKEIEVFKNLVAMNLPRNSMYEKRYMEDAMKKSAEEMKDDVKESSRVVTDSKTEVGGVSQKSKSVSSSATEQDLDVFLLGDLGDNDDGPGFKNSNWAKEKVAHVIFTSCRSNLKYYWTIPSSAPSTSGTTGQKRKWLMSYSLLMLVNKFCRYYGP